MLLITLYVPELCAWHEHMLVEIWKICIVWSRTMCCNLFLCVTVFWIGLQAVCFLLLLHQQNQLEFHSLPSLRMPSRRPWKPPWPQLNFRHLCPKKPVRLDQLTGDSKSRYRICYCTATALYATYCYNFLHLILGLVLSCCTLLHYMLQYDQYKYNMIDAIHGSKISFRNKCYDVQPCYGVILAVSQKLALQVGSIVLTSIRFILCVLQAIVITKSLRLL